MTEKNPRILFISYGDTLSFLSQVHATQPMHISSEAITKHITAWPFPKRSPIYRSMDWMSVWGENEVEFKSVTIDFVFRVTRLNEVGLTQLWKQKAMNLIPKHPANKYQLSSSVSVKPEQTRKPLHFEDFYSIFLVFSFGITLSVLVFICEVVYFLLWKQSFGNRIVTCPWGSYLVPQIKRAHGPSKNVFQLLEQLSYIQLRLH